MCADETAKLDNAVYFETGLECDLKLQEGWTIYIPSASNLGAGEAGCIGV